MSQKSSGFAPILFLIVIVLFSLGFSLLNTYKNSIKAPPESASTPSASLSPSESSSPTPSPTPTPTPSAAPSPKITTSPSPKTTPSSYQTPSITSIGNYTALTYNLSSVTVVTDTANDNECPNNCPTKPLAQYISENGGRAGMNGTYFCPQDYASCSSKVNSFDFAVWNNRHKKWINASTLFWEGRGMMVFRPGSAQFFSCANCTGAPSDITGGIVNYPSLLSGGNLLVGDGTKGTRSGIGFGGGKLFLVVARNASYLDLANIFKSLGASEALNLDGGGSVALYDGGYKAGPGRNLPNAVIIK